MTISQLHSILIGTAGLAGLALVALALTLRRGGVASMARHRLRLWGGLLLLVQAGHFVEETRGGFYRDFPEALGLQAWPINFFVAFNLFWLLLWVVALAGLARFPRVAAWPLWFLGLASLANGVVHPLLALTRGGYYPGFASAPLAGLLGAWFVWRMFRATQPRGSVS